MYAYEIGNELIWFYTHCAIAIVIVIADAQGTFEPFMYKWEKKLGIPVPEVQNDEGD